MNRQEQTPIDEILNLINTQQEAIKTASEIIDLKNKLIKICEEETNIWKKEAKYWRTTTLVIIAICFTSLILKMIIR